MAEYIHPKLKLGFDYGEPMQEHKLKVDNKEIFYFTSRGIPNYRLDIAVPGIFRGAGKDKPNGSKVTLISVIKGDGLKEKVRKILLENFGRSANIQFW